MNKLTLKFAVIFLVLALSIWFGFPLKKRINLGLDLEGGMHLLLKVDTSKLSERSKADIADVVVEVMRNRIDRFGVREPSIQRQGVEEIVIQLPGLTDRDKALEIIGKTALLEFKLVSQNSEKVREALSGNIPEGYELKYYQDEKPLLLEKNTLLTGDVLKSESISVDFGQYQMPEIIFELNPEGAKKFSQITTDNVGRQLAIILDGKIHSAPVIKTPIPDGRGRIEGRFSFEEAQNLVNVLKSPLPAPVSIEEERTIGPLLGQDSINKGVKASLIGTAFVFVFMMVYYLFAGVISSIALAFNFLIILGCLGMLPVLFPGVSATLTLPGIAGIALALGMAIDANVLINERIREEAASGQPLATAIANGYQRAFSAIFDSNVTTLIAAFLLFQFGTGPIRGFAVTLTIGLIASMFTAIFVTRAIFELLLKFGLIKSLPMLKLFGTTRFDFIGKRKIFYAISLIIIISGLAVTFSRGKSVFGIDFSGGQLQEYKFKDPVSADKVREKLKEIGLTDASIQQFKDNPNVLLIRTAQDKENVITGELKKSFPQQNIQVLRIEKVGPLAGKMLGKKAALALFWSLIGILIYVAFRFKHWNFAVAGIIAIFHDVLVAVAFMAFTKRPIDLLTITALLSIIGYSINDTIVIYDRVRENSRGARKGTLAELINLTVNQMFSRTILTSAVTLMVVLSIFLFGGEVLSNFAFVLLVGFISGVYSTVYIASPLVLAWSRKNAK